MALARNSHGHTQTRVGASSIVQISALIAVGVLALSIPMVHKSRAHVVPTLVVIATSGRMKTAPSQAQIGSVV